jgi:hypothetical protein
MVKKNKGNKQELFLSVNNNVLIDYGLYLHTILQTTNKQSGSFEFQKISKLGFYLKYLSSSNSLCCKLLVSWWKTRTTVKIITAPLYGVSKLFSVLEDHVQYLIVQHINVVCTESMHCILHDCTSIYIWWLAWWSILLILMIIYRSSSDKRTQPHYDDPQKNLECCRWSITDLCHGLRW